MKVLLFLFLIAHLVSCESDELTETDQLTSKTWSKPEVLHHPPAGVYTTNSCAESYQFKSNGEYTFIDYCDPTKVIDGTWTWVTVGQEIKLEISFNGIPQKTNRILILGLSENELHTKEMEETEPLNTTSYWELKYKPK